MEGGAWRVGALRGEKRQDKVQPGFCACFLPPFPFMPQRSLRRACGCSEKPPPYPHLQEYPRVRQTAWCQRSRSCVLGRTCLHRVPRGVLTRPHALWLESQPEACVKEGLPALGSWCGQPPPSPTAHPGQPFPHQPGQGRGPHSLPRQGQQQLLPCLSRISSSSGRLTLKVPTRQAPPVLRTSP